MCIIVLYVYQDSSWKGDPTTHTCRPTLGTDKSGFFSTAFWTELSQLQRPSVKFDYTRISKIILPCMDRLYTGNWFVVAMYL